MSGNKRLFREHPLRILKFSAKNIWLLLFPMIRGLHSFALDADRIYRWLKGSWADIAVLVFIILTGFFLWRASEIEVTDTAIIHRSGVIIAKEQFVPRKSLTSVMTERPFYLRPFSAVRISFSTGAQGGGKGLSIIVSEKAADGIANQIKLDSDKSAEQTAFHKSMGLSILLFSVFFSSSLSGAVYIAAFFLRGGIIARDIITSSVKIIKEESQIIADMLAENIPPAAAFVGAVFPLSWIISFVINLVRYSGFQMHSTDKFYRISCGALSRRTYVISKDKINYTVLRQNLIMKLFRITAVNICCSGYSSENRRIPVLMPIKKADENCPHSPQKKTGQGPAEFNLTPGIKSIFVYIRLPLLTALGVYILSRFLKGEYPALEGLTGFAAIMAEIPLVWLIIVKAAACLTSGIRLCCGRINVKYSCGFSFFSAETAAEKLTELRIAQSPFQRITGKCSVDIRFAQERGRRHRVKGLDFEKALHLAEITGYCGA